MPITKYSKSIESVLKKPIFYVTDLVARGISQPYAKKLLHLLAKSGRIKHIERGKYTVLEDAIAVASHITMPCYISLWSAMSIRNLTTQIPFAIDVITSRKRFKRRIEFMKTPIVFHLVSPRMMFGYVNIIWKENIRIAVARPEKIIIDALYTHKIPKDELIEVIKVSNIEMLRRYAKLTRNKYVIENIYALTGRIKNAYARRA